MPEPNLRYVARDMYSYDSEPISTEELEALREQATALLEEPDFYMSRRSCWVCNIAHTYLINRGARYLFRCFDCGRAYYQGVDITLSQD